MICPKCGYVRKPDETVPDDRCPACGVYYAKVGSPAMPTAGSGIAKSTAAIGTGWIPLSLAAAAVLVAAVAVFHDKQAVTVPPPEPMEGESSADSGNGFVALPVVEPGPGVTVIAAQNCPKEDARRADNLAVQLRKQGIPVVRSHEVRFRVSGNTRADMNAAAARVNSVMNGKLPIVFVRSRAKSNPTLEEVVAEFEYQRRQR